MSLNETGRSQAERFYKAYHHLRFDVVHTSELKRSQETVASFIDKPIPHEAFQELDEISWGKYEGIKSSPDMKHEYKEMMSDWANGIYETKIEGGESPIDLQARQRDYLRILEDHDAQKILICSHGRAMRSLICTMLEQELSKMSDYPHGNLSLYKFLWDGDSYEMTLFNNRDHLKY